jgi:hypothetical protein
MNRRRKMKEAGAVRGWGDQRGQNVEVFSVDTQEWIC